jgi:EmrB/QacA subfamily drug resistance transporter
LPYKLEFKPGDRCRSPLTEVTVSAADKRLILTALAIVLLLSALDQSIVSTAMPRIIEQLHGLEMYAWVTTAYLLTSTVSVPIYGKLSDLYGRKPILIIGVLLFLLGSALCGLSGELGDLPIFGTGMMQLVVFRGLQGLGGGALMTVTVAIIADLYPPRERGRLLGVFGSVFGFATVIGPFIGGFFTDHGTVTLVNHVVHGWRWVFYVNLPLGLLALFMILYRLPPLRHRGEGKIDYIGGVLLITTFAPLLLGLTLGGTSYPWASAPIAWLFGVAAASLLCFLWVEKYASEAILPLHLFRIKAFSISTLASFVISMSFLGVVMFMPLYMQVVQGVTATNSGVALLPLMTGLIVSSIVCGRLVSRTGRYKVFMVGGGALLVIGMASLTFIGADTTSLDLAWRLALTGIGLGPAQSLFNVVISNSVPVKELGAATSVSQFSRQIGSTVGVAMFGALLTHNLTTELPRRLPLLPGAIQQKVDLSSAQSQVMNVAQIRTNVDTAMRARYELIERAYRGDEPAVAQVLGDEHVPESMKAPLRDGRVMDAATRDTSLELAHAAMSDCSTRLVERIQDGMKQAFSASISRMLGSALWIVIVGVLIVLFIPELPLRSGAGAPTKVEV